MQESVIRPAAGRERDSPEASEQSEAPAKEQHMNREDAHEFPPGGETQVEVPTTVEKVIWTPKFLLTFALVLILGLSIQSLFAVGWSSRLFVGQWIILAQVILVALGWLGLGIITRSRWIRLGCIFGGIWAVFMSLNIFTNLQGIDPNTPVQSYINVATSMALLGAYVGLSIESTLLTNWDTWLFFLVPVLGTGYVVAIYFQTPQASILTVENAIAAASISACCLFWWLRPSCWKKRPGPAFIFGLVPIILLIAALINTSMHDFFLLQVINPSTNPRITMNYFFFTQVILLCLLLGCIRMAKSELPR